MATDSNNSISNSSCDQMIACLPASDCIPWLVVLITECLAIVILNIITIIVFVKQRQLQRQSTYLIIHLAIVDLLVGAVSGPLQIEINLARFCNLWEFNWNSTWSLLLKHSFMHLFSFASLANLVCVSLERLHATFRPFKHRFIKKRVYVVIIAAIWLTTTVRELVQIVLQRTGSSGSLITFTLYILVYVISVCAICVSYLLIVIKVRCSRHPHRYGAARGERKLTGTSFIVAILSLLLWLPVIIYLSVEIFHFQSILNFSSQSWFHVIMTMLALFLANSIINPAIYAQQMPVFRAGLSQIFGKNPKDPAKFPLRNLKLFQEQTTSLRTEKETSLI